MEFINKNRELINVISSYIVLVGIVLFLVVLYKSDHTLTGDHLASAKKNAAATISLIIWSVMFGIMLIPTIINTLRFVLKTINQGKITPSEAAANTSRIFSYIKTKIIITLGTIGLIIQSVFIALSVNSGSFALVVFWGVMLGITLLSSLSLYTQSKKHTNTFSASDENS